MVWAAPVHTFHVSDIHFQCVRAAMPGPDYVELKGSLPELLVASIHVDVWDVFLFLHLF